MLYLQLVRKRLREPNINLLCWYYNLDFRIIFYTTQGEYYTLNGILSLSNISINIIHCIDNIVDIAIKN